LRLRAPQLCIGEVYLLPLEELDDGAMRRNSVEFKLRKVNVGKFIKIFNAFTHRDIKKLEDQYRYDVSALILVDLKANPARIITRGSELSDYGFDEKLCSEFDRICAFDFDKRVVSAYYSIRSYVDSEI